MRLNRSGWMAAATFVAVFSTTVSTVAAGDARPNGPAAPGDEWSWSARAAKTTDARATSAEPDARETDQTSEPAACNARDKRRTLTAVSSLPATGQTRCWDGTGVEVDCEGTGQDGDTRAGAPLSYSRAGDGRVIDHRTGLMWEAKDDSGGIHDKDATYSWAGAFSVFIDALNNTCEGDGVVRCDSDDLCGAGGQCGFAGYRDWRLPNVRELQSIADYSVPYPGPTVHPIFESACSWECVECSCTAPAHYWSSTSFADHPTFAWGVLFRTGYVRYEHKGSQAYVRAVRSAS